MVPRKRTIKNFIYKQYFEHAVQHFVQLKNEQTVCKKCLFYLIETSAHLFLHKKNQQRTTDCFKLKVTVLKGISFKTTKHDVTSKLPHHPTFHFSYHSS